MLADPGRPSAEQPNVVVGRGVEVVHGEDHVIEGREHGLSAGGIP